MSSVADHSLAFWTAPVGGTIVTFLFGYPSECTGSVLDGTQQCTNLLGSAAFMLNEAGAAVVALVVGLVCYGIASLVESHFQT
jgi:hypothetical protein